MGQEVLLVSEDDGSLRKRLQEAESRFALYESRGAKPGTVRRIKTLRSVRDDGLDVVLSRRRAPDSLCELTELIDLFKSIGPSAVLMTGSQRGGDFLDYQLRGQWAEAVCCSMDLLRHVLRRLGPSGAAMPGEDDHARVVRAYAEIMLLEGKRPDLVALDRAWWESCSVATRAQVDSWPERLLEPEDEAILGHARAGIEVKTSAWHYEVRRRAHGGPLAITVKDEELEPLTNWSTKSRLPVLFLQVLFDEVYCMSFRRMLAAIKSGKCYANGDYVAELDRKSKKLCHRIFVNGPPHLCAKTVFPDKSEARLPVLPNGMVIPHLRLLPAQAADVLPDVIEAELNYTG